MARFARFLAAVLCFPLVWALCLHFVDSFFLLSGPSEGLFSAEAIALFAGLVAFLALLPLFPPLLPWLPVRLLLSYSL